MISLKKDCSLDQMYDGICRQTLRTPSSAYKQYRKRNIVVFNNNDNDGLLTEAL